MADVAVAPFLAKPFMQQALHQAVEHAIEGATTRDRLLGISRIDIRPSRLHLGNPTLARRWRP
jgi:FixJ family two-component response regulator